MTANIYAIITFLLAIWTAEPYTFSTVVDPPEPIWTTYEATAYVADCAGCIGITRVGLNVKHTQYDEDGRRIIATDPDYIALGSVVEIRLSTGYTFTALASDTGSGIRGNEIDVLMPDVDRAIEFGRQDVGVRIIDEEGAD